MVDTVRVFGPVLELSSFDPVGSDRASGYQPHAAHTIGDLMPSSVPPGTALCSASFTLASSTHTSVITWGVVNTGGVLTATAINNLCRIALLTTAGAPMLATKMSNQATCVQTKVLLNTGGVLTVDINTTPVAGTLAISTVPLNCAELVRKNSSIAGRAFRGRMFVPPVTFTEAVVGDNGVITPAIVTSRNTDWAVFFNNLATNGIPMAILHPSIPGYTLVAGLTVNPLVGTLRRRLRP